MYSCGRCLDTGEIIISYRPEYATCPLCKGTLEPPNAKKVQSVSKN